MSDNTPPGQPSRPPEGSGAPPPPPPPSGPPQGGPPPGDAGGWGSPPPPGGPGEPGGWGGAPPPPPGGPAGAGGYSVGNAFSYAFEKFKANWGPLVLITLVLLVGYVVIQGISQVVQRSMMDSGDSFGLFGLAAILSWLFAAATIVLQLIVQAGIIQGGLRLTRNQQITFSSAFEGINWGQVIAAALIIGALTFVGFILCIIPGIIVLFLTSYTLYFVIDRGMTAIDGIKASVDMVRNNLGVLLLFFLATVGVQILGTCLCLVGLLAAIPINVLAQVYTFRTLNDDPVQA
jgi:hypothetical protein